MATYLWATNVYSGKTLSLDFRLFYVEFGLTMPAGKDKERNVTDYCDWMSQLPAELHNIPLCNLAIPGMKLK